MKGKLLLIGVGVGIGYILGAKAGRERYDQIAEAVGKVWHNPTVQKGFDTASTFLNDRIDDAAQVANTLAKRLVDRMTTRRRAARRPGSNAGATSPGAAVVPVEGAAPLEPDAPATAE